MAQQFRLVKYYFIYHENYGKTMEKWVKVIGAFGFGWIFMDQN